MGLLSRNEIRSDQKQEQDPRSKSSYAATVTRGEGALMTCLAEAILRQTRTT
jgi:hypothetical protein